MPSNFPIPPAPIRSPLLVPGSGGLPELSPEWARWFTRLQMGARSVQLTAGTASGAGGQNVLYREHFLENSIGDSLGPASGVWAGGAGSSGYMDDEDGNPGIWYVSDAGASKYAVWAAQNGFDVFDPSLNSLTLRIRARVASGSGYCGVTTDSITSATAPTAGDIKTLSGSMATYEFTAQVSGGGRIFVGAWGTDPRVEIDFVEVVTDSPVFGDQSPYFRADFSDQRRRCIWISDGTTSPQGTGDRFTIVTASVAVPDSTGGNGTNFTTGASSGTNAGLYSPQLIHRTTHNPWIRSSVHIPDFTSIEIFIGVTDTDMNTVLSSDDPSAGYAGWQFSTNRSDTNWQCVSRESSGGTQEITDSGLAVASNSEGVFDTVVDDAAGEVRFYFNGVLYATHATHPPATNTNMRIVLGCQTRTAATRVIRGYWSTCVEDM